MKTISKSVLALTLMGLSATSFAYSVKTIDCFDNVQMAKKKKLRKANISLVSAKIGKAYEYALFQEEDLLKGAMKLSSGIHILSRDKANSYSADIDNKGSEVKVVSTESNFFEIKGITLSLSEVGQNASYSENLTCYSNMAANKMGPAYQRAYEQYFGAKNSNFTSLVTDTLFLADIYMEEKTERGIRGSEILSLKKSEFKLVTTSAYVEDDGGIFIDSDDSKLVACRVTGGKSKVSKPTKGGDSKVKVECLEPRFKTKTIKAKKEKRKWFVTTTTQDNAPILVCAPSSGRSQTSVVKKPLTTNYSRVRLPRAPKAPRTKLPKL